MALVSPGVETREISAGGSVTAPGSSPGAIVIDAEWGPVNVRTLINSEANLVRRFGEPNDSNAKRWLTAANFLSYVGSLYVTRAVDDDVALNSTDTGVGILISNDDDFESVSMSGIQFAAKYPGEMGDSIQVSVCDSEEAFDTWTHADLFSSAPGTSDYADQYGNTEDEMHVVVVDEDGLITGTPGTVLETFEFLSKASDAKNATGGKNYYRDVINTSSEYVWSGDEPLSTADVGEAEYGDRAKSTSGPYATSDSPIDASLSGGEDSVPSPGDFVDALQQYASPEHVDISVILTADGAETVGDSTAVVANAAITIAEARKDCLVTISPMILDSTGATASDPLDSATTFAESLTRSSYAFVDSGYKYMYDRYADKNRWVPLNGDTAGLISRLDRDYEPWFSPGGFTRGNILNIVKLAWNPNQSDRDSLYKNFINPVVSFPGQGTILYGDKMFVSKSGPFDRVNVRRLFIVVRKAVAEYARGLLFELNDSFTRSQFVNAVNQYLANIQSRRGLEEFRVIADTSNNTPQVINNNQFVGDILIRPLNSINFIRLNFIAVRSGVDFSEIAG